MKYFYVCKIDAILLSLYPITKNLDKTHFRIVSIVGEVEINNINILLVL